MKRWIGRVIGVLAVMPMVAMAEEAKPVHVEIESKVLHESRAFDVWVPDEAAKQPKRRFEVLYVLDGASNGPLVRNVTGFLTQVGLMQPTIVVSLPNRDTPAGDSRNRDFTPIALPQLAGSGKADVFLVFLRDEVLPYVDTHFPSNGVRTLHGHSLGGTFALYALATDPSLFGGYVILDPSVWADKEGLLVAFAQKLPTMDVRGKAIYIAARSGRGYDDMGISALEPVFRDKAPKELSWKVVQYADETHSSIKFKGTYDGFRYTWKGYGQAPIHLDPFGGIVLPGKPIAVGFASEDEDIRYTTDGTQPGKQSARMELTAMVSVPEKTRFRLMSNKGIYDQDIAHHLVTGKAIAGRGNASRVPAAWRYAIFDGARSSHSKPLKEGAGETVDINHPGPAVFVAHADRDFVVKEDGYHLFLLEGTDKATLLIDGKRYLPYDVHPAEHGDWLVLPLKAGVHSLSVDFHHESGTAANSVTVFQYVSGTQEPVMPPLMRL
ncbi:putative alpha/beta superfamily hydrolase [Luteibacter sp. Sphag1AF]|uniref:alpha/beta hydrolase-fold protein n=1 Tax=Luteibacter sp. Sphag1AF TaxID=2587031 RepID=UPI00160CF1BD|nr:alpha/beta hydrolase-fold protein [Luteibacter sp. Sphag1AF]MBB3228858.1 putative alpha/beta superfamily hydrolase [Luteibacter sp. Sphag1AF]